MRRTLLVASLALCLPVAFADDLSVGEIATSAGTSASLYSTFKDRKLVLAARDDASSFVASGGAILASPTAGALVLRDYVDSLVRHGFKRIVIVPTHGGNFATVRQAIVADTLDRFGIVAKKDQPKL